MRRADRRGAAAGGRINNVRARIFAGLTVAILIAQGSARAAEPPLTDRQITGVLASWSEMAPIVKKYKDDPTERQRWETIRGEKEKGSECVATPEIKATATYREVMPILTKNGFDGFTDWCLAQTRVFKAYFSLRMQREAPDLAEKMAAARHQIETAPDLSAEQKKQLLDRMAQSVATFEASDADKQAIGPHVPELDRITAEMTKDFGESAR